MPKKKLVQVKVQVEKALDGTRIMKSFYGPSKLVARNKANEYLMNLEVAKATNEVFIKKEYTFGEWANKWLETYKKDVIQDTTYRGIKRNLEKHIYPYFGSALITNIKPIDIENFFKSKSECSSALKSKLLVTIREVFKTAIANDLCYKNPAMDYKLPPYKKVVEKNIYSESEIVSVVKCAVEHEFYEVAILLKTGLRRGELLALEWSDINISNMTLNVNKAVKSSTGKVIVGTPKTKAGYRIIPFDNDLKKIFIDMKEKNQISKYLIHSSVGRMYLQTNWNTRVFTKHIKIITAELNLDYQLSTHELRHTFGTHLYNAGVDLRTIQKIMGHSNLDITSNLYVHDNVETMRKALKYS